jgi:uncharacterized protein (TIGR02453 family)
MPRRRQHFTPAFFRFLRELADNNRRTWFQENRSRYERHVREPALKFVGDFAPYLMRISPHFRADPRPVGGSLFRIHRDTRFSRDKRPYKTAVGIQFRHERGKDAHAPGFYLHLEPGNVFMGVGIWHPDPNTLGAIRQHIVENSRQWSRIARGKQFAARFDLAGDSLKRPPRGFDADHPLIEDLKRKDFIAIAKLKQSTVVQPGLIDRFAAACRAGAPFVRYLCAAVDVPF